MTHSQFSYDISKADNSFTSITLKYLPSSIKNTPISISVAPEKGSNMYSMTYGSHELIYTDREILNQAGYTGTYVLFPMPNRMRNFTYKWRGKTIELKKFGKRVTTHHQLVYDQPFTWTTPIVTPKYAQVTTYIQIDATSALFDAFPFPCSLSLTYTVSKIGVSVAYTVVNEGQEALPFGFGLHPHFVRLSGDDNTFVTIPAKSWMEAQPDTLLPSGILIDVSGKPYNVQTLRPIGELSLDHVFTDLITDKYSEIEYRTLGFKVQLITSDDFTHTVIYTGNKNTICLENQTCSTDAINLWNRGFKRESHLLVLHPQKSHAGTISYNLNPYVQGGTLHDRFNLQTR